MRLKVLIIIILTSFSLTSCIEIIEEMWVKKDRSGKVSLRVESGAVGFLFTTLGDYIQPKMLTEITSAPATYAKKLKEVKGVSKVHTVNDLKNGQLGLSFEFANPSALNHAWYSFLGLDKKFYHPRLYKISRHKLKKKNIHPYLQRYLLENKEQISSPEILKLIRFVTIYHLPGTIKKSKNQENTKLKQDTIVIQSHSVESLMKDKTDLSQVIHFN